MLKGVMKTKIGSLFDGSGGFPLAGVINGIEGSDSIRYKMWGALPCAVDVLGRIKDAHNFSV